MTRSPAHAATDTDRPGALRALRVASTAAVVIIVLQGVTAGEILSRSRVAETLHFGGAFVVHLCTGLTALAAFLLARGAGCRGGRPGSRSPSSS